MRHTLLVAACVAALSATGAGQKGKVVESGAARPILSDPQHPYSRQLKDAVLSPALASARDGANGGSGARPLHAS